MTKVTPRGQLAGNTRKQSLNWQKKYGTPNVFTGVLANWVTTTTTNDFCCNVKETKVEL